MDKIKSHSGDNKIRLAQLVDENQRLKMELEKLERLRPTWREIREFTLNRKNGKTNS